MAVVIDPTDRELSELERMLANCPNCSRWSPGDGPIMAIILSQRSASKEQHKELL